MINPKNIGRFGDAAQPWNGLDQDLKWASRSEWVALAVGFWARPVGFWDVGYPHVLVRERSCFLNLCNPSEGVFPSRVIGTTHLSIDEPNAARPGFALGSWTWPSKGCRGASGVRVEEDVKQNMYCFGLWHSVTISWLLGPRPQEYGALYIYIYNMLGCFMLESQHQLEVGDRDGLQHIIVQSSNKSNL